MNNRSRESTLKTRTLIVVLTLGVTACGGCHPEAKPRPPAKRIVAASPQTLDVRVASTTPAKAQVQEEEPILVLPTKVVRSNAAKKKVVAPTTEVFGLRAAPEPVPPKVIRLPEMVVEGTPTPKVKPPPRLPSPPPSTGARLAIEESHNTMSDFRLVDVEYVLNGKRLDVERDDFTHTNGVFDGRTRAGVNTLLIRATARGVAKFPFLYLEDLTFVTEEVRTFTASPGDQVTIATIASSDGDLLKPMKDRFHLNIGIAVAHRAEPTVGMR